MANIQYTTGPNERWDTVSTKCYGSPAFSELIIKSNPDIKIYDVLPQGTLLNIPVLETADVLTDSESLPPWKR
ncbi:MAG: tail protein X [Sphingobacteriaceae bacterium]|nr:tail protein X [Sphingobacteriaceae bacterium]